LKEKAERKEERNRGGRRKRGERKDTISVGGCASGCVNVSAAGVGQE
jgi:hypothetical protein